MKQKSVKIGCTFLAFLLILTVMASATAVQKDNSNEVLPVTDETLTENKHTKSSEDDTSDHESEDQSDDTSNNQQSSDTNEEKPKTDNKKDQDSVPPSTDNKPQSSEEVNCETLPPELLSPEDGATDVSLQPTFKWTIAVTTSDRPAVYDVYLAKSNSEIRKIASNLEEMTFTLEESLKPNTDYHWKVVAKTVQGCEGHSSFSHFTTGPWMIPLGVPCDPHPEDGATNIPLSVTLSWSVIYTSRIDNLRYTITIASDNSDVRVIPNLGVPRYTISSLRYSTLYQWHVTVTDSYGQTVEGPVWTFTTRDEPEEQDGGGGGGRPPAPNKAPTADLSAGAPYEGLIGDEIAFDGSQSSDPDGEIVSYVWDFGDENFGEGVQSTHVYDQEALFQVKLTVTDDDGATDTVETSVNIIRPNAAPLTPDLHSDKVGSTQIRHPLTFEAVDPDNDRLRHIIDWGDGKISVSPFYPSESSIRTFHYYDDMGIYELKVYAQDDREANSKLATTQVYIDINVEYIDDIIKGRLLDYYYDGSFDSFINDNSGVETDVGHDENEYYIDSNNDGEFEYTYAFDTKEVTPYQQTILSDEALYTLIFIVFVIILILFLFQNKGIRETTKDAFKKLSVKKLRLDLRQRS